MAHAKRTARPITAAQIKRIHTQLHILGVSDENYRAALESRFGVTTCKDLTLAQAKSFIDELQELAHKTDQERYSRERAAARARAEAGTPKRFDELDNRPGMASAAQLRKIEAMWTDISDVPDPAARARALRRFLLRIAKVSDLRFLDDQMAGWVINALNVMKHHKEGGGEEAKPKKAR
ncbi:regulatory protein GemA [Pelobacter propionicus]|uniref:Mu-like prophage protein gp16 n=1 Tax=Pelobacter propionicus (strain DSM 2379 / NBRC 103807 / OttBd1) TaxID=338966 RepID=A1ARM2_PELPD|nr:regulatory protein GemA [Pelobacter propionicus]ABK99992.1 hypothetical protein Ppro_2386 [Pelobacter propionicus DSM 2379]